MTRANTVHLVALGISLLVSGVTLVRAEDKPPDLDEETLNRAELKTDDASLLAFIRQRTAPDEDLSNIDRLIEQLGAAEAQKREEASKKLGVLGVLALPKLRQAVGDKDPEQAARVRTRIEAINFPTWVLPAASVRLLLKRKPAGTAEALYRYLPCAQCEETEEDIWFGLDALAAKDEKLRESLAAGLKDRIPARRALAACVLGHVGSEEQRGSVRGLLDDKDPTVRLRAGQGLLAGKDKSGVPTLIALLEDGSVEVAWQAEELLTWACGKDSPAPSVGTGTQDARKKARLAWEACWAKEGTTLDLAKLNEGHRRPGLVLIAEEATVKGEGRSLDGARVWLTGCDGEARWEFTSPGFPHDARLLPSGRVLLAESEDRDAFPGRGPEPSYRVTERGYDGKAVWEAKLKTRPRSCQRLPDGRTFIAGDAVTVDAAGNEVARLPFDWREDRVWCAHPCWTGRSCVRWRSLANSPGCGFTTLSRRRCSESSPYGTT